MTDSKHKIIEVSKGRYIKEIFGEEFDPRIPDIIGEMSVLNSLFPDRDDPKRKINVKKALKIFEFLYRRYYDDYIWNQYEELYITTSLNLMNDFCSRRKGSDNQFLCLLGPSNVGKTFRGTAFYNWLYLMNPTQTRVVLTSNKVPSTMQRVWSDYLKRFNQVKKHYPKIYHENSWRVNNSKQNMKLQFVDCDNDACVTATSLNKEVNEEKTVDSFIGFHGLRYFIFIDESTSCSTAIHGAKENLANNVMSHVQLSGNPNDPHNLLGHTARPKDGYDGFDWDAHDTYRNEYGTHIYFNPEKSPAILDPDPKVRAELEKHKYPTLWKIKESRERLGGDHPDFYRFVLGRIKLTSQDSGVISQRSVDQFNSLDAVEFSPYTKVTHIGGFDPSTGHSHSDLSALVVARVGMSTDGIVKICFGAGNPEYIHKLRASRDSDRPPLYQMVDQAQALCARFSIRSENFGSDIKPLGISDIIFNEWTKDVRIIDGGAKADCNKIKKYTLGAVPYNKITECYLQLKQYIECGIVGGIPEEVLKWLYARKIFEIGDKLRLEGKAEFAKRTRLGSPDVLDAMVFCLDTAIWSHGLSITRQKMKEVNNKIEDIHLINRQHHQAEDKKKRVTLFNMNKIRKTSYLKRRLS